MSDKAGNSHSGSQACAACRYQRRKCAKDCPLAPFFPPHRQKDFLNAHKLFGVSNIVKTIRDLNSDQKKIAMNSIVFEANARANDPVYGCCPIMWELQRQYMYFKAEYDLVLKQLSILHAQMAGPSTFASNIDVNTSDLSYSQLQHKQQLSAVDVAPFLEFGDEKEAVGFVANDSTHGKQPLEDVSEDIKPLLIFDDVNDSTQCSKKVEDFGSIQDELQESTIHASN
ncbi:LOB domain-containing protein 25-like [Castanea sativa]|uniref:LOB domain-containing protein 25-like n=1 Tax=Castanea sativa TaxID=21020 RepID=UPI003F64C58A